MITIEAAITGGPQTGFTTPVWNTTMDTPQDVNSKQSAITSATGTVVGVDFHSVARPFTVSGSRPKQYNVIGKPNPVTGLVSSVPRNTYKVLTRKGVTPLAGQPSATMIVRTEIEVPAGADVADPANVRAALSAHIGLLLETSAGLGDTAVTGLI